MHTVGSVQCGVVWYHSCLHLTGLWGIHGLLLGSVATNVGHWGSGAVHPSDGSVRLSVVSTEPATDDGYTLHLTGHVPGVRRGVRVVCLTHSSKCVSRVSV